MNWDQIAGQWKLSTGKIKAKWGKLTDDDLKVVEGNRDQLSGKIQERYGLARTRPIARSTTGWRALEQPALQGVDKLL